MRLIFVFIFGVFLQHLLHSQGVAPLSEAYFDGQLIVKIKPELREKCNKSSIAISSISKLFQEGKLQKTDKLFPRHKAPKAKSSNNKIVDISTIYKFEFGPSIDAKKLLHQLRNDPNVEYAELHHKNYLAYSPSDSLNGEQWYLDAIHAYEAWDVQKGDTSVIIAFTDTGSDMDHEDLVDDFAYNYNDPVNGIDDDNEDINGEYSVVSNCRRKDRNAMMMRTMNMEG